jgi:hypothetical protein
MERRLERLDQSVVQGVADTESGRMQNLALDYFTMRDTELAFPTLPPDCTLPINIKISSMTCPIGTPMLISITPGIRSQPNFNTQAIAIVGLAEI